MNQLTEAKELNRQAAEKITEYELLEEARRRGYVSSRKIKCLYSGKEYNGGQNFSFNGQDLWMNSPGYIGFVIKIYDSEDNRWAEIIPEEEKSFPLGVKVESEVLIETKSLHDQIREGGWLFIFNKSKMYDHIPTMRIFGDFPIPDEIIKVGSYNRLLALSKVLNEGKEEKGIIFCVYALRGQLQKTDYQNMNPPIYFITERDRDFALDFAEKEWKIFYNAK